MLGLFVFAAMVGAAPDVSVIPSLPVRGAASDYRFDNGIVATPKPNDLALYVLLGSGWLRPTTFGDPKVFVSEWLKRHPKAAVVPVSRSLWTNTRTHQQFEIVYVWLEDGSDSLNVDLIRAGVFPGGTMYDTVDNQKGLEQLLKSDPKLADVRARIQKDKAAAPTDRDERLVSEEDYKRRITLINEAEQSARAKKIGIWSDAMKWEREADGLQ